MSTGLRPAVVALDVGGTDIKAAVMDAAGPMQQLTRPTRAADGPEASLRNVIDLCAELGQQVPDTHTCVAVGLAVPGAVDEDRGLVLGAENLGWQDVPVRDMVHREVGLPIGFGHDVRAGGLAEWRLGAGVRAGDMAYVSIGTGVAAALVLEGRMLVSGGYAGEIGHGGAFGDEECACGGRGCAETFASAAAIARQYSRRSGREVAGAAEVLSAAHDGDPIARQVWDRGVDGLGELLSQLVRVTGVPTIVIGGGMVRAGRELLDPLEAAMRARLTIHRAPELLPARLGSDAGTYGAALLGWQAAGDVGPSQWEPVLPSPLWSVS